jgi:membrane-associated HD superfamily phosphohydrolase
MRLDSYKVVRRVSILLWILWGVSFVLFVLFVNSKELRLPPSEGRVITFTALAIGIVHSIFIVRFRSVSILFNIFVTIPLVILFGTIADSVTLFSASWFILALIIVLWLIAGLLADRLQERERMEQQRKGSSNEQDVRVKEELDKPE